MYPNYTKIHNKFKLNGNHFNFKTLKEVTYSLVKEGKPYEQDIGNFLLHWQDQNKTIAIKTSGSTGKPKTIKINKQAMVNSAIATGDFFKLKPGNTALLCLPAHYIAGKMMLVRAMILGLALDYIEPKSKLNINTKKQYHFSAMVPLQLRQNINIINNINNLIIGGAKVSSTIIEDIQNLKTTVFETYGMTETVSHIAVKQLNGSNKTPFFKTLPNVFISQNKDNCLIIKAPLLLTKDIETNDIVAMQSSNTFKWLGRKDNVINSGGIKIIPEEIESKLIRKIKTRFFIASEEDKILGNRVVLIVEGKEHVINTSVFSELSKHEIPKKIHYITSFIETASGKVNRKKTLKLLGN